MSSSVTFADATLHSQRATETASSLSSAASSSLANAQAKLHAVSDNLIAELGKLQSQAANLSDSLQTSTSNTLKDPTAQLPPQIQQRYVELTSALQAQASAASATYADLSNNLALTVAELRGIMADNASIREKAMRITHEVQPLLEVLNRNAQHVMSGQMGSPHPVNGTNGHAC